MATADDNAPGRHWVALLALVVGIGAAVRAVYVLWILRSVPPGPDSVWYTLQGGSLRAGTGYSNPPSRSS